jgi:hypothetical protein
VYLLREYTKPTLFPHKEEMCENSSKGDVNLNSTSTTKFHHRTTISTQDGSIIPKMKITKIN